jgi:hypothetical protein
MSQNGKPGALGAGLSALLPVWPARCGLATAAREFLKPTAYKHEVAWDNKARLRDHPNATPKYGSLAMLTSIKEYLEVQRSRSTGSRT